MALSRPLPGIRFEAQAPPSGDVLPRMDIPAFAGFAASGPIHQPVAVEDAATFEMIFGAALPLANEAGASTPTEAYLAPAVRAFFRNGGRRCWIVRLARDAQANRFLIPGLQTLADDDALADAYGVARSAGSWSDGLSVQTNLNGTPLQFVAFNGNAGNALTIDVVMTSPRQFAAGDLLRLTWLGDTAPVLFLLAETIVTVPPSSPPPPRGSVRIGGRTKWFPNTPPDLSLLPGQPVVERLTFDLTVNAAGELPLRMAGLGFAPDHPRYWAALPDDAGLYADPSATLSALWADAATPRFPLAAETGETDDGLYLPTGMTVLFSDEQPAEIPAGTALERDGLASFDAGLFLDPALGDATVRDLLDVADFIRYQSSEPRPLTGIHAALGIDEATLIAVPDAVQRGWLRAGASALSSPPASSPLAHPEWWRWLDCNHPQTPAAGTPLGAGGFIDCDVVAPVEVPLLAATAPQGGTYDLFWTPVASGTGTTDILQEATRPDFSDAADVASGPSAAAGRVTIHARAAGDLFYRVRRQRGSRTSDWSNGVGVHIDAAAGWTLVAAEEYSDSTLVAVHKALVTMCAARGDLVGILSLPMHYDERRAIAHPATLTLDSRTLSYGALWHPWLILRDGSDGDASPLKAMPPDGATAGVLAARAIGRGAWIAPANEPLRGPVALTPAISAARRQDLQDAAVNLIRQEPGGFVCLDADTLSPDDEVRPINVRRLIALVRRAALQVGNDYTFEPNDDAARRAVQRAFESMLETLYVRGAFAGATEQDSFQVVTDASLNTASSVDAGRLIAEIRIAPSRPLSFLTIRLVQANDATVLQEATP
jgi:phage tail sheath protein FI